VQNLLYIKAARKMLVKLTCSGQIFFFCVCFGSQGGFVGPVTDVPFFRVLYHSRIFGKAHFLPQRITENSISLFIKTK